jgi:glycosyltransferase involved in cell wall biosynthesis
VSFFMVSASAMVTGTMSHDMSQACAAEASDHQDVIRVVFCWAEVSHYMAACWRALAQRPGLELHVVHPQRLFGKVNPFHADPLLLHGVSNETFQEDAPELDRSLLKMVSSRRPDIIVLCGWFFAPYRRLVHSPELAQARVILGMDTPWRGTPGQRLTRFRFAGLFKRLAMVVTAGERSREYARHLGVRDSRVQSGFYGHDFKRFSEANGERASEARAWPRQFLFLGRYLNKKGIATLIKAYASYRAGVSDPWGLTCCGAGPDGELLKGAAGVVDAGFTQPADLPALFRRHGAFVLPSYFEPWGVVIAEAAASGLPIICTTACGSGVDIVRPYYNGLVVTPGDVAGLSRALRWIHEHESELPAMGRRSQSLAEAFSAEAWAARWHQYFLEVVEKASDH